VDRERIKPLSCNNEATSETVMSFCILMIVFRGKSVGAIELNTTYAQTTKQITKKTPTDIVCLDMNLIDIPGRQNDRFFLRLLNM
jgi:hypothetical protein